MARTDNDTWEITESVGATALGVAAARAAETRRENPLISDPFAQVFLDAVGDGVWNWHSAPQLPAELIELEPELPLQMQSMVSYGFPDSVFRPILPGCHSCGHPPGSDPGGGPGLALLAAAVAGRHHGLRTRPAQGVGVQIVDFGRARGGACLQPGRGRGGPASGLADGVAAGGF